jgi:hypothetical protein
LFACWSAKGGSGATVVAASLALHLSRVTPSGVLLVDLGGDADAVLGQSGLVRGGVAEWLASSSAGAEDLRGAEVDVTGGLALLPRGSGSLEVDARWQAFSAALAAEQRAVVIDCGVLERGDSGVGGLAVSLAGSATHSLLVTRLCFLGLRRAVCAPVRPSGVVVLVEPGRALRVADVEGAVGAEVVAELPYDPAVARAVDAGLLARRLPPSVARALRSLVR